jgi:hypothetical protein
LSKVSEWLGQVDPSEGFEVVLMPTKPLDPLNEPQAAADSLGVLAEAGATIAKATLVHHSVDHYLDQLAALVEAADGASPAPSVPDGV